MEKNIHRVQIIVAVIGVAGVLGTALISNWDKLFTSSKYTSAEKPYSQSSSAPNSPNVANVQGEVSINISSDKSSRLNVPNFQGEIDSPQQSDAFSQFIDKNRGKIVHISVQIDESYSRLGDEEDYVALSSEPCNSANFYLDCISFGLTIIRW